MTKKQLINRVNEIKDDYVLLIHGDEKKTITMMYMHICANIQRLLGKVFKKFL